MKKKLEVFVSDGTDTKLCLNKDDAMREAEKLIDYFAESNEVDVITICVVPSANYEMGI